MEDWGWIEISGNVEVRENSSIKIVEIEKFYVILIDGSNAHEMESYLSRIVELYFVQFVWPRRRT